MLQLHRAGMLQHMHRIGNYLHSIKSYRRHARQQLRRPLHPAHHSRELLLCCKILRIMPNSANTFAGLPSAYSEWMRKGIGFTDLLRGAQRFSQQWAGSDRAKVTSSCSCSIPAFGQKLRLPKAVQRAPAVDEDPGDNQQGCGRSESARRPLRRNLFQESKVPTVSWRKNNNQ